MQTKQISYLAGLAALCIFLAASCQPDEPLTPHIPDDSGEFSYKINGLKDTALERTGEVRYLILVERLSGKSETVILSAEDLPKGMEVLFEPANSEQPSFNTTMVIRNVRVAKGTHKIKIKGASPTSGISNYFINVKVLPYTNAAVGLKGNFTETGQCTPTGGVNHNVTISVDESVSNRIIIKGLFSGVMTNVIYADLQQEANTLVIPSQKVNSVTYTGDGSYDDDKLIINYKISGITINEDCTSTLTRD